MAELGLQHPDGGDYYVPDVGQRIDAQGRVTYDFTGHVHAQGLDLDAGVDLTPPVDRRVRWINAAGAVVADVWGTDRPGLGTAINVEAFGADATADLIADTGAARAEIFARAQAAGTAATSVTAMTAGGGRQVRVLADDGTSSFVRLGRDNTASEFRKVHMLGPFQAPFNFPAGSSQSVDVVLPAGELAPFAFSIPSGDLFRPAASAWIDAVTKSYEIVGTSIVRFSFRADAAPAATAINGIYFFQLLCYV